MSSMASAGVFGPTSSTTCRPLKAADWLQAFSTSRTYVRFTVLSYAPTHSNTYMQVQTPFATHNNKHHLHLSYTKYQHRAQFSSVTYNTPAYKNYLHLPLTEYLHTSINSKCYTFHTSTAASSPPVMQSAPAY